MGRLDGKVAIVTGGAGGIGSSAAHIFAREGAKVVVADLDEQGAISTAEDIKAAGGNAIGVGFNQGDETSIKRLIEATIQAYGALHVLLNNAAMLKWAAGGQDGQITELETDIWRGSYKINVEGVFLVTKHALPHLLKTGNASVINVASMNGHLGDISLTAYGTTKSSILGFSRYVAVQYGKKGVRCNSISPGVILTAPSKKNYHGFLAEITTKASCLNRLGEPEDIGNLALFLASDESSFATGQDWKCDGGIAGISPPQTAALREYLEKKQKL